MAENPTDRFSGWGPSFHYSGASRETSPGKMPKTKMSVEHRTSNIEFGNGFPGGGICPAPKNRV
jgi:hypothetical protein